MGSTSDKLMQIANNSTKLYDAGKNSVFKQFPESLQGSAIGATCALTDISSIEHTMEVKLKNKNLIPYPYSDAMSKTTNGITFTVNEDRSISIKGTSTGTSTFDLSSINPFEEGKTYVFNNAASTRYLLAAYTKPDGTASWASVNLNWESGCKFTKIYLQVSSGMGAIDTTIYPQIEEGTVATNYMPYISDFSNTKLFKQGKNLLNADGFIKPNVFVKNSDGSYTYTKIDGSSGRYSNWAKFKNPIPAGTKIRFSTAEHSGEIIGIQGHYSDDSYPTLGDFRSTIKNIVYTLAKDLTEIRFFYSQSVADGTTSTLNNLQIEVGTVTTEYEPYIEPIEYQVETDGTVKGVTSIYPVTTLSTDGSALVSCNYIKDIEADKDAAVGSIITRSITEIVIPKDVTEIGAYAFISCSKLTKAVLHDGITKIDNYGFGSCTSMVEINIPDSVTALGEYAFNYCPKMTKFIIGKGVKTIGKYAFNNCLGCLEYDFSRHEAVPTLGTNAFNGINANAQIIIPYALYSSWSSANNWKDIKSYLVTKGKAETGADVSIDMIWIDGTSSWMSENRNDNPDASIRGYCKKDGVEIDIDNNPYFSNVVFQYSDDGSWLDYHFTTEEWDTPVMFYQSGLYEFGVLNEDGKVTYRAYVEVTGDTPTFTFAYQYTAEYGMTFGDWVNSKYNTDGFYISGNGVWQTEYTQITEVTTNDYGYDDYRGVTVDEVIKPDGYYIIS